MGQGVVLLTQTGRRWYYTRYTGDYGDRDRRRYGGLDMARVRVVINLKINVSPVIKVHFPIKLFNIIRRIKWRTAFTGRGG